MGWEQEQPRAQPEELISLLLLEIQTLWLLQHLLYAHPDLHDHFHQKFPKKPQEQSSRKT